MPSNKSVSDAPIIQFHNCRILKDHKLRREDLWIREGKILNPEKLFFDEKGSADVQIDCKERIIAPGYIDVQINGGYGYDFSLETDNVNCGISVVAKKLLSTGVTSFCPTIITSPIEVYQKVLPRLALRDSQPAHGSALLVGVHLEGPFISEQKKGAHLSQNIRSYKARGFQDLLDVYGSLDNVSIVTLAPEMERSEEVTGELVRRGIRVSLGHSIASLSQAEAAVKQGATFITHLFNAMLPFHHRDPGIVGLLTSDQIPDGQIMFYGLIADGIHTNPAALRIAHRAHPSGLVLVTDAVAAMGLPTGQHTLGQQIIHIDEELHAYVAGPCSRVNCVCVSLFHRCSVEAALEAASLHPAQLLGIDSVKGQLEYGMDADMLLLDDELNVKATYIAGQRVWKKS
uniref:N-acetylglucosamine-6-phosphate deacetylase n=1 Tax=Callorhinchus milii TaxID=7868 RepID=A0A4W3HNK5_CALMI